MKIIVDEVVYDVVKEKEINGCIDCFLKRDSYIDCLKITNINCIKEKVIFLKVPDSMKNCEKRMTLNILENFSGLLGKQYLYLQDDGTYYNRYIDEYMTEEAAVDWLYSELSEVINK